MNAQSTFSKVVIIDKRHLRMNDVSFRLYGDFSLTKDDDHSLFMSIVNDGIKEALYITKDHVVISGNRRLHIANLLNSILTVPAIFIDLNSEDIDDYLIIQYQQQRVKDIVDVAKEYSIILEKFNSQQGKKNPRLNEAREKFQKVNSSFSERSIDRVRKCHKLLLDNEGFNESDAWKELKKQVQRKTKISFIEKQLVARQIERDNKKLAKNQLPYQDDFFKLIHDDARNIKNHIRDRIVDNVTCSPPYFSMKTYLEDDILVKGSGRKNIKLNQIGQENSIPEYIDSLIEVLTQVNAVIKETSSVFVNVMDSSKDGIVQRIPDKLINAYEGTGDVTFIQYIYWYKRNVIPRYENEKKFQTSLEYILHFVKNPKKYKWVKWVDKNDKFFGELVIGGDGKNKVFRNVLIYPDPKEELNNDEYLNAAGLIQSNAINNHKLNKLLEEKGFKLQHNALYSVEIPMMCILSTTNPGDTVLDPWSGLGTTGIVAYANGCKYYGFDISEVYTAKASIRIKDFLAKNELVTKVDN
jgi:DNA modification methylase